MNRIPVRTFSVSLSYYRINSDHFATLACRSCRGGIDMHQPDPSRPEEFLGTCSKCGRWYRIAASMETGLTVLELPEIRQITDPPPRDGKD